MCEKCGGSDFIEQGGYKICRYCHSQYAIQSDDMIAPDSVIAISDDVNMLLQKCRVDPSNARRYASLVLDIDPSNVEAQKYL
jgi:hypothetical protein